MTTILVTGAGGYIGSVACSLLLEKGYEVVALDNFTTGFRGPLEYLQKRYGETTLRIYETSLEKTDVLFEKETAISAVLHYAAHCSVNESMLQPEKYFNNNVMATGAFLKQLITYNIRRIVFSSTCAVYGEAQYTPIDEIHPTSPANPYGESKLMAETMIRWYGRLKDMQYLILRYFNVCGATDDGLIGDSKKPSVHLMQNALRGALNIEPFFLTCGRFDTPDGTPIRDYVNVVDLNNAHILALEYLLAGKPSDTINLGTGTGSSVLEIVKAVQDVTGYRYDLQAGEARAGEYARMIAATQKAKDVLGWQPQHTLAQSVESLVKWYSTHPHGWEK